MRYTIYNQLTTSKVYKNGNTPTAIDAIYNWIMRYGVSAKYSTTICTLLNSVKINLFDFINEEYNKNPIDYNSNEIITKFICNLANKYETDDFDPDYKPEDYRLEDMVKNMFNFMDVNLRQSDLIETLKSFGFNNHDLRWLGFTKEELNNINSED